MLAFPPSLFISLQILAKLQANIDAGHYYEAQQMFKTVYHRHRARKMLSESYSLAEVCSHTTSPLHNKDPLFPYTHTSHTSLLPTYIQEGAKLQFNAGQLNCGVELSKLLLEAYEEDNVSPTAEAIDRISHLLACFPTTLPSSTAIRDRQNNNKNNASKQEEDDDEDEGAVDEAINFISSAQKWLKKAGGTAEQSAGLEGQLASYIVSTLGWQSVGRAAPHFALASPDQMPLFAKILKEAVSHGKPDWQEEDLFLARAALQMAGTGGRSEATLLAAQSLIREVYTKATKRKVPDTPMMHFVEMFLEAIKLGSRDLVAVVMSKYRGCLENRDAGLMELVDRVKSGRMEVPGGGLGGLLGGLLG